MRDVGVVVDSHLRVDGNILGHDLAEDLMDAVAVRNTARDNAEDRNEYGWEKMPEWIELSDLDGDTLILPRGFAVDFKQIMREEGFRVKWIDNRTWEIGEPYGYEEFSYRQHQPAAIAAAKHHQQGIYKAPTGSGKTVAFCGFLWEKHPQVATVLVDRIHLVSQWQKRIHEHIGPDVDVGIMAEGEWTEGRINVATVQSVYSRLEELIKEDWFDLSSFALLDECHHATAETYRTIMDLFTARWRMGTSATPDKTGDFDIALNVLGKVFYEDDPDELEDAGLLVKPHVRVIHTSFDHIFWGDHHVDDDEDCEIPNCRKNGTAHGHRNNYAKVKAALIRDKARNNLIARAIDQERESGSHHQLVVSDEIRHLDEIMEALENNWSGNSRFDKIVFRLTGKENRKKRDAIIDQIESQDESIIFSTIANEALDIPIIDRVHLPFPSANPRSTEQKIGRGTRTSEGKTGTVVLDYADTLVPPFAKQFRTRRWKCYEVLNLPVKIIDRGEL